MEIMARMIAQLRRERGMTQEALAERIGVSPQTVSKWETQATCPDVALLPVVAEVFGVTIDALYGRDAAKHALPADAALERVIDSVRETIVGVCWNPETDGPFDAELEKYRRAMASDVRNRSVIENERDVLYFREALGALALRRPEEGWNTLFADEEAAGLLALLSDGDFRRAMQTILRRRMLVFTLASLAKSCGVQDENRLADLLERSGCFLRRELVIDEKPLIYYELTAGEQKLFLLYAALAFAGEFAHHAPVHYCFFGSSGYFTP